MIIGIPRPAMPKNLYHLFQDLCSSHMYVVACKWTGRIFTIRLKGDCWESLPNWANSNWVSHYKPPRMTKIHHSAIKNVAVNLVMQMQGKYRTERPISGCQFVCIIWLKRWKVIEVNNVLVESRIEIKRQQPHCGFWEEGKGNSHVFHKDRKVRATEWWKSLPNWAISNWVSHLRPHAWPKCTTQQSRI